MFLCLCIFSTLLFLLRLLPLTLTLLLEYTLIKCFFITLWSILRLVAFVCGGRGSGVIELIGGLHYNDSNTKKIFKHDYCIDC